MSRATLEFDPYLNDPERWGVSMAQVAEIMLACLDAARAKSVAEVGAFAGDLTRVLVAWAARAAATVQAIDPAPQPELERLAAEHPELDLIRQPSLDALPAISLPDAIVIDGDHNYYTVNAELRIIGERAAGAELPLLLFHDVGWPHGRRDDYFDPRQIPSEARREAARAIAMSESLKLDARVLELERELEQKTSTVSWRFTAPLRVLNHLRRELSARGEDG